MKLTEHIDNLIDKANDLSNNKVDVEVYEQGINHLDSKLMSKLDAKDLTVSTALFPTNVEKTTGVYKLVNSPESPDYNTDEVEITTDIITGVPALLATFETTNGDIEGVFENSSIIVSGDVMKISGRGYCFFWFKLYKNGELVATSTATDNVQSPHYVSIYQSAFVAHLELTHSDVVRVEFYGQKVDGTGSGAKYKIKLGGSQNPNRIVFPTAFSATAFLDITQETGTDTGIVMSQDAVTKELENKLDITSFNNAKQNIESEISLKLSKENYDEDMLEVLEDIEAKFDADTEKHTLDIPTSPTDTGMKGDIKFDSDYIYTCVATDTWKRTPISSDW